MLSAPPGRTSDYGFLCSANFRDLLQSIGIEAGLLWSYLPHTLAYLASCHVLSCLDGRKAYAGAGEAFDQVLSGFGESVNVARGQAQLQQGAGVFQTYDAAADAAQSAFELAEQLAVSGQQARLLFMLTSHGD